MEFISNCTADTILKAAQSLKDGHLVAFPTETVYGLGADATNEKAVSRIYSVKGRPVGHPLIVHISSINKLDQWATDIPDYAIKLGREFWPGPMTLILPRTDLAKDFITGGQNNVGLRVPAQPIALALLKKFDDLGGQGIAAPSANRFGAVSPTTAEDVSDEIGDYLNPNDSVLDGGQCLVGIESTIVDCTKKFPVILRPGAITKKMIESIIGNNFPNTIENNITKASGSFKSHYSPKAEVVINEEIEPEDGVIALSNATIPANAYRLCSPLNINEYANLFYGALRKADKKKIQRIVIVLKDNSELAEAIMDRARKASIKDEN
jgi:L-threonylcarbamoyladenylate synthase